MTEENTLQQEVNRLTTALDHAERLNETRLDVCRAAQRLHDALHLAGVTWLNCYGGAVFDLDAGERVIPLSGVSRMAGEGGNDGFGLVVS